MTLFVAKVSLWFIVNDEVWQIWLKNVSISVISPFCVLVCEVNNNNTTYRGV